MLHPTIFGRFSKNLHAAIVSGLEPLGNLESLRRVLHNHQIGPLNSVTN